MDGVLYLDKPQQMTSFAACALLRRLTGEKKVGHAGTLDPMATGVLPLFFGKATRAIPLLSRHDKTYVATLQFGKRSDTLDIWGTVSDTHTPLPTAEAIEAALSSFRGEIFQVPPMTSALKQNGVRLYELARQGIEVERAPRSVTIFSLETQTYDSDNGRLTFTCHCSAGTYIRTLCDDLGNALGCGAVMTALRRVMATGVSIDACLTPDECRTLADNGSLAERLLPTDAVLADYEALTVTAAQANRFKNGGALALERLCRPIDGTVRVYSPDNVFLGLGTPDNNELQILRLF